MQVIGNQQGQPLEFLTSWLRGGGGLFADKTLQRTRRERCRCNPGTSIAGVLSFRRLGGGDFQTKCKREVELWRRFCFSFLGVGHVIR